MSVCVVLKVSSLESVVELDAVYGAPVDVEKEPEVGNVERVVAWASEEGTEDTVFPMVRMICEDLVGRCWTSFCVMGRNSASRTDWKER